MLSAGVSGGRCLSHDAYLSSFSVCDFRFRTTGAPIGGQIKTEAALYFVRQVFESVGHMSGVVSFKSRAPISDYSFAEMAADSSCPVYGLPAPGSSRRSPSLRP